MGPNYSDNESYEQQSDNVEAGCNDYESASDDDSSNYPDE